MPPVAAATTAPARVMMDPWDDGFFLGGKPTRRPRTAAVHGKTSTPRSRTSHVSSQKFGPTESVVVGKIMLSGDRANSYGRTYQPKPRPNTAPAGFRRDFNKLNKAALRAGLVTAKEQWRFREVNPGFVKEKRSTGRRPRDIRPPVDPAHVYGTPTLPSTPINGTLRFDAGREWLTQRHEELKKKRTETERVRPSKPVTTRTVMLRRKDPARAEIDIVPPRLNKSQATARPHVSTFRSNAELARAHRKHEIEAAMQQGGYFGMGLKIEPAGMSRNL